jgi:hypothetical protein
VCFDCVIAVDAGWGSRDIVLEGVYGVVVIDVGIIVFCVG